MSLLSLILTRLPQPVKKIKYILKGIGTYLPSSINRYLPRHQPQFYGQGRVRLTPVSARTCYSLWLRHLVKLYDYGLPTDINTIAEFGPGDSLGVGLVAMLTGANRYYALDITKNAFSSSNIDIFDELVELLQNKSPIPDNQELPKAKPILGSYEFPNYILTEDRLRVVLNTARVKKIHKALLEILTNREESSGDDIVIRHIAPWGEDLDIIQRESIDMIYSIATMEHVGDISKVYRTSSFWLKKGGVFAHAIDFKAHGTAPLWNGHWACSDFLWRIIKGRSIYLINREPHSVHIKEIKKNNCKVVCDEKYYKLNTIKQRYLATRFKNMTDDDLKISSAFIVGQKR